MTDTPDPLTPVSTNPPDVRVDYLQEIVYPVAVRNNTEFPIVLDDGFLEFEPEHLGIAAHLQVPFTCNRRLEPGRFEYFRVPIKPNLLYRPYTNVFSATFRFRRQRSSDIGAEEHFTIGSTEYYIIVGEPPAFDNAFISFKDPQDDELSVILCTIARRAGFRPYRAKDHPEPGINDYWEGKIRPAIRSSRVTLALWTTESSADPINVRRELQLSREGNISVVLLRENDVEPPEEYPSNLVEHVLFERRSAWAPFAQALASLSERRHRGRL